MGNFVKQNIEALKLMRKANVYSLADISKWLQDKRLMKIREATGLTMPTLSALRDNLNYDPRLSTLFTLTKYINHSEGQLKSAKKVKLTGAEDKELDSDVDDL